MPSDSTGQAGELTNLEIEDRVALEAAVLDWLTCNLSLHREGGLGDVTLLVEAISPHVRIRQRHHL
jgi:hypothetical protein